MPWPAHGGGHRKKKKKRERDGTAVFGQPMGLDNDDLDAGEKESGLHSGFSMFRLKLRMPFQQKSREISKVCLLISLEIELQWLTFRQFSVEAADTQ